MAVAIYFYELPQWLSGKESSCKTGVARDIGSIPRSRRSLEEGKAIRSSILAWRIPWTEEPGRLKSTESQRVEHDWSDLARMHASTSTRIKLFAATAADLQHPLKGVQCGEKEWGICAQEKTGRTGLQIDIFRRFYDPNCYTFSYLEKHFTWWRLFLRMSRNLLQKKYVFDFTHSPFTTVTQRWTVALPLGSSFSEPSEVLSPGLLSSFCPK